MQYPQLELASVKGPQATIKTNLGEIKIQLFEKQAPKTVNNFVQLAEKGYYDGVIFHRVIPDFMIQEETQPEQVVVVRAFTAKPLRTNSLINCLTLPGRFRWLMLAQTPMEVSSLLFLTNMYRLI